MARCLAYYLPQFYPIPENDKWWGEGFTDWQTVKKAKPLFIGHEQPRVPGKLGYYDLRDTDVLDKQITLAKNAGIEGFCFWHYWFGNGIELLKDVVNNFITDSRKDFGFCLAWANHSWYKDKFFNSTSKELLIKQEYPGKQDIENHFYSLLPAFLDSRYTRIDNKPVFVVYRPFELPEANEFIYSWNSLAIKNGLTGIYFIAYSFLDSEISILKGMRFDAINIVRLYQFQYELNLWAKWKYKLNKFLFNKSLVISYTQAAQYFDADADEQHDVFPCLIPNWDHSPRSGRREHILMDHSPENFKIHADKVLGRIENKPYYKQIVFLKSWNEWAEGNYLEPDQTHGTAFLDVLKDSLKNEL